MPEYLSPAVFVEEVDTGSKPIEGVSTSTTGMVGVTERGPAHVPILVTSFGEYQRIFGGYLNRALYPEPNNLFPHAAEGFFTNLGQRLYVVRALDVAGALRSSTVLYDRGENDIAETRLLRIADVGTGPLGTTLPYLLDTGDLDVIVPVGWIRIGEGSTAEYRQTLSLDTDEHVDLDLPLARTHDANAVVDEIVRTPIADPPLTDPPNFTLEVATVLDAEVIRVTDTAANTIDIVNLITAGTIELLEIGPMGQAEYRFATEATVISATVAEIRLAAPLALTHDAGTGVQPLDVTVAPANSDALETEAPAGDVLVFLNDDQGAFNTIANLVLIDGADVDRREVRRIGALGDFEISTGAYEDYGREMLIRVMATADTESAAGLISNDNEPNLNDTSLTIGDITNLEEGRVLRIDVGGVNQVDVIITAITPGVLPVGDVDFDRPLPTDFGMNEDIRQFLGFVLTADAAAGDTIIEVNRRVDVLEGNLLRIGDAPDDEYIQIDDIPNLDITAPPDPGNIVLTHPLGRDHPAGTIVYLQDDPVLGARQPTALVFNLAAGDDTLLVSDGTGYAVDDLIEMRNRQGERFYHRVSVAFAAAAAMDRRVILSNPPLRRSHAMGSFVLGRDQLLDIQALDAGIWGDRLRVAVRDEPEGLVRGTQLEQGEVSSNTVIRLNSALGVEEGTILEFSRDGAVVGALQKVDAIDRRTGEIILAAPGLDPDQNTALATGTNTLDVRSREFRLDVYLLRQPDPAVPTRNETVLDSEFFRYLSLDDRHPRHVENIIGDIDGELRDWDRRPRGESLYIRVRDINHPDQSIRLGPDLLVDVLPSGRIVPARRELRNGFDSLGTVSPNQINGTDSPEPEDRTGIQALRNYEDISLVAAPGRTDENIQRALIEHCEAERFRFAVLDGPEPPDDTLTDVQNLRQRYDTKYAAIYHPWLHINEPYPTNLAEIDKYAIPPAGHMIGVFARTDVERGVHKAPANEVVRGINGLERVLNKREHDILNPSPTNINVIRDFRENNRGIRVWGGRCITSDTDWKYVNVRRLLIFIEHSIERGLQWVVFEPNYEPTWARVVRTISNFLTVVWRNGALEGTVVEEAFFVKCDRTTMTQTDIDNGRLICHVGVAPVKPAEFVIIRIGLWTAHADSE